ncbi:N-acyl amino acid synthase FeeM domain-containing protein [Arvimicrobium flavum]|uniref:N-acyl amino acid synthase FeeM domain-containing protein n=1 Tax=Arvimicrobium flavum TaxID=3393320 RepID=UPI00237ADABE|nr:hypothetical protein [Mesorhizobium shangrilense]
MDNQGAVSGGDTEKLSVSASGRASDFVRHVFALLEKAEYRRCESGEDLEDIYRLRYKAYRANDMVPDTDNRRIHDELDETPNAYRFGIYIDGVLLSTLRVHHVTRITPLSPSTKAFGDIVYPMLEAGDTFVCPSRFASDPEWTRSYPHLAYVAMRLAPMACFHFGARYGLSTVREDHAGFYRRIYYSEPLSEPRSYPGVFNRVVLYRTDAHQNQSRFFTRFPFFRSTETERRMLFAEPAPGELAPLTVLPTAKFLARAA